MLPRVHANFTLNSEHLCYTDQCLNTGPEYVIVECHLAGRYVTTARKWAVSITRL